MNKLKGLILKDLYVSKKQLLLTAAIYILGLAMAFLFRFAYIYGNLKDPELYESEEEMLLTIEYLDFCIPLLLSLLIGIVSQFFIDQSLNSDMKCRWNSVVFAAGIPDRITVGAKYVETLISTVMTIAIDLLISSVYYFFFPNEHGTAFIIVCSFAVPFLLGVLGVIRLAMMYAIKNSDTVVSIQFAVIILLVVLFSGKFIKLMEALSVEQKALMQLAYDWLDKNSAVLAVIMLAAFIVIVTATYFISVQLIKRREKLCGA